MRSMIDMETIQIEITNCCVRQCANCSRFVGHLKKPFFMDFDTFKQAVDSLECYPKMVGIQGGEPLLHPQFEAFCNYLHSKFPKQQCGLWTCFPEGYERYRNVIYETFEHIFLNDHTRPDVYHHPALVALQDYVQDVNVRWALIDHCWAQMSWSASINPKGAYFCEMAGAFAMLYDDGETAWPVEKGWWWRIPKDFGEQMEKWCHQCGMPLPVLRTVSVETFDYISPYHYERLKGWSHRIKKGEARIYNGPIFDSMTHVEQLCPRAAYKDFDYRNAIARRYGMYLTINQWRYWSPHLIQDWEANREAVSGDGRSGTDRVCSDCQATP